MAYNNTGTYNNYNPAPNQQGYEPYNPYLLQQPEQDQQQQGMDPMQGLQMYQQFAGEGGMFGGSATTGGTTGATAGAEAGMSSAGAWGALAEAIIISESEAIEGGYRDEDASDYLMDVAAGDTKMAADIEASDFSNAWDAFKKDSAF